MESMCWCGHSRGTHAGAGSRCRARGCPCWEYDDEVRHLRVEEERRGLPASEWNRYVTDGLMRVAARMRRLFP